MWPQMVTCSSRHVLMSDDVVKLSQFNELKLIPSVDTLVDLGDFEPD